MLRYFTIRAAPGFREPTKLCGRIKCTKLWGTYCTEQCTWVSTWGCSAVNNDMGRLSVVCTLYQPLRLYGSDSQCVLYSVHCVLYYVYFHVQNTIQCISRCSVYTVLVILLFRVYLSVFSVYCILYTSVYSLQCILCPFVFSVYCTVYPSVYSVWCTVNSIQCDRGTFWASASCRGSLWHHSGQNTLRLCRV